MKKYLKIALTLTLLLWITACTSKTLIRTNREDIQNLRYVTVNEIGLSLPTSSIVVGFDIDDTVLFSSPGFNYGLENQDGPGGTNLYGGDPLQSQKFWNDMNGKFDKFSLPKKSGGELVKMHYTRGDKIVFITARNSSDKSIVSQVLAQSFGVSQPEVIFTSGTSKTKVMNDKGVDIYYGDADSDISQAKKAKARPIRVIRSHLSTNNTPFNPGKFDEEVLIYSEE
ncbi:HAD family acid phosphatase [Psychrilyobacter sp.]|uniref:HAD family acid phosphatase n=1 Tax=Psychrilyobacter sp. TaxID=2586924 RepID=UPI0030193017